MTSTQLLALVITGLAVVLAADLVRLSWANRRKQQIDVEPGFRRVGTFGSLRNFESSSGVSSTAESTGGGHSMIVAGLLLILLAAGGVVFKVSWDEAHPDIRTRYGRDFEYCVAEKSLSRWNKAEVEYCIRRLQNR